MKISSIVLSALFALQASCAATPRDDDYSQLEALLQQAQEVAKEELAAAASNATSKRTVGGTCTLQNLSIRREW